MSPGKALELLVEALRGALCDALFLAQMPGPPVKWAGGGAVGASRGIGVGRGEVAQMQAPPAFNLR
eukprot:10846661-Alexandrium_andersonii.AAC.1